MMNRGNHEDHWGKLNTILSRFRIVFAYYTSDSYQLTGIGLGKYHDLSMMGSTKGNKANISAPHGEIRRRNPT